MKSIASSLLLVLLAIPSSSCLGNVRGIRTAETDLRRRLDDKGSSKKGLDKNGFTKKGKKGPTKRDCDTEFEADAYEFKCKSRTQDGDTEVKDSIDYSVIKGERGVEVNIKYEQEVDTKPSKGDTQKTENKQRKIADVGTNEEPEVGSVQNKGALRQLAGNETETSYDIIFDRIVEYVPLDGSMAFNFDNEIVQNISLLDWGDFTNVFDDANDDTSSFSVTSTDGMSTFTFTITRAQTNETASANAMKIDFRLTDFPWARNDTYVALITFFETERKVEVDRSGPVADGVVIDLPDEAVSTTGLLPFGQLTWATTAEVTTNATNTTQSNSTRNLVDAAGDNSTVPDNTTTPDNTTVTDDGTATSNSTATIEVIGTARTLEDGSQEIAFSFVGSGAQGASDIYWDPEIGVNYADASTGQSSKSSFAFGLGFVVMSSLALLL